jgi:hypothetical protein
MRRTSVHASCPSPRPSNIFRPANSSAFFRSLASCHRAFASCSCLSREASLELRSCRVRGPAEHEEILLTQPVEYRAGRPGASRSSIVQPPCSLCHAVSQVLPSNLAKRRRPVGLRNLSRMRFGLLASKKHRSFGQNSIAWPPAPICGRRGSEVRILSLRPVDPPSPGHRSATATDRGRSASRCPA